MSVRKQNPPLSAGNLLINLLRRASLISEANPVAKAPHYFPVFILENAVFPSKIASLIRKSRSHPNASLIKEAAPH